MLLVRILRCPIWLMTPLLLGGLIFLMPEARADTQATIDAIEQLPRAQRLDAYREAVDERGLSRSDRLALVKAFANHARLVSPHYEKTDRPLDTQAWGMILEAGLQADPRDATIAEALARLHINDKRYSRAVPAILAMRRSLPDDHRPLAWQALCNSRRDGAKLRPNRRTMLTFPLHFCVLTRNPEANKVATLVQCRKECDIANKTFVTHDGDPLVRFVFKGYSSFSDIQQAGSEMIRFGDSMEALDGRLVEQAFNACRDRRVRDPQAINVYVYDAYSNRRKFADLTSVGRRNSNRPFIFLDWQRLDNKIENPEAHELGHAFGLPHVGVPGATKTSATNIMNSFLEKFGQNGLRTHGFTEAQTALILYHAQRTSQRLGLGR